MRPLRLQVENLASFRGRHEPLDFSKFELFAIAGPTGAGKSSLLDAMVFALYGKVPRLGKAVSEMVAVGRDRMAVTFDFSSGGKIYRVVRALNRGKKARGSEAALEEIIAGEERPLADGPANVDKALERIVGLGYDAFTQAVILPQGEFQRFLKSQPRERRAILGDLLRLQVYGRMYDGASEEAKRLGAFLQGQQAVIEGETETATPEAIAAMRTQLAQIESANAGLKKALAGKEKALATLRDRRRKTMELEDAETRDASLRARQKELEQAERRLSAAAKAEQIKPRIDAAERARNELKSWSQKYEKCRRAETEATLTGETARRALQTAEKAAEKLPKLAERLRDLDAVSGLVGPLESARRRLGEAKDKQERSERDLEGAKAIEREARTRARDAGKASRAAAQALKGADYDAGRHQRLELLREPAVLLGQLRGAVAKAESERADVAREKEALASAEAKASGQAARSEKDHAAAEARTRAAEEAQREAERAHAATHLRAGLREGEACPVCEQPVARIPAATAVPALDDVRGALETAREAAAATLRAREAARQELAHATAAHRQARERAERAEREAEAASRAREEAEGRLATTIGKDLGRGKGPLEARLRALLEQLTAEKQAYEARTADNERAQREDERAQQALATATEAAAAVARALEEQQKLAEEARREAHDLKGRIDAVTRGADPAGERERLENDRARLAEERELAQRRERETAEALLQAKLEREQAQHAMADAQRVLGDAGTALDEALAAAGFKTASAALGATLDEASRAALGATVDAFRREAHAVQDRLQELRRDLGDGRVATQELQKAEDDLSAERVRLEDGAAEAARLSERAADLERRAERAKELSLALQRDRRRQAVYQQLTTDLRSENFRAFLLEEAFRELVIGASERLMALSGRYTFEFEDDAFQVIDHDNAGERRSAETLSGGETFLASLALALELSQQIQRAAGAVHLDSLFIDEGFGTLDPESLDTIAGALEDLPVGGRMVGIITHLTELTDRLPHRVRVEKRQEGSTFSVETA